MKFKLDANLGVRGAQVLRAGGHDVATADEEGLGCAPDDVVIAECTREGRALVTLDMDFANPFNHPPARYAGIVVVRIPNKGTSADIEAALRGLLAVGVDRLEGRLLVADYRGRVREHRRPPDE